MQRQRNPWQHWLEIPYDSFSHTSIRISGMLTAELAFSDILFNSCSVVIAAVSL